MSWLVQAGRNGKKSRTARAPWHVLRRVKAVVTGIHAVSTDLQFERALLFSGCSPGGGGGILLIDRLVGGKWRGG